MWRDLVFYGGGGLENPLETMMELNVLLNTIPVALYLFLGKKLISIKILCGVHF